MTLDTVIDFTIDDYNILINWYTRVFGKNQNMTKDEELTYYKLLVCADQEVRDVELQLRNKKDE